MYRIRSASWFNYFRFTSPLSDFSNLSCEFFLPEHCIILAESIATNLRTYFRIKLRTLYGNRPKPVIVVEIHRKKTVDHTKEHEEKFWNLENFEDETSSEEIESADCADSDILRILKFLLGISEIEVLEQIESDKPQECTKWSEPLLIKNFKFEIQYRIDAPFVWNNFPKVWKL